MQSSCSWMPQVPKDKVARETVMLSPLLSPTIQHGLSPLSAIREYTWESSLLEISPSVLLTCLVHPRATALLAEQTGFIFPQQQTAQMQFLMVWGVKGSQGWAMGPLQMRGWSLLGLVVFCHPCWEGVVDSGGLSRNTGDAAVASS